MCNRALGYCLSYYLNGLPYGKSNPMHKAHSQLGHNAGDQACPKHMQRKWKMLPFAYEIKSTNKITALGTTCLQSHERSLAKTPIKLLSDS